MPLKIPSAMLVAMETQNDDALKMKESSVPLRRYSTTQEQQDLDDKLRRLQKSSLSRRSSAVQSPLFEALIARITQSFQSRSELTKKSSQVCSSNVLLEQLRRLFENDDDKIPDDYWPCAPDGFIPNSVVRLRVPPKKIPDHLIPRVIKGDELTEWMETTRKPQTKSMDSFSPISIDDDIGSFSIFDGYAAPVYSPEVEKEEQVEEEVKEVEECEVMDEEDELKKRWKASMRTTFDKEAMTSQFKSRQQMKERKKVSRKPALMPVIVAEEEEEEIEEEKVTEKVKSQVKEVGKIVEHETRVDAEVPQTILMGIVQQPWFPGDDVSGLSVEAIYGKLLNVMSDCAPLTYHKICSQISDIQASIDLSDTMKKKTIDLITNNLGHISATIRKASIRAVEELNCKTRSAITGIISCLNHQSTDLQNDAIRALQSLLGITDKEALRELFISLNILPASRSQSSRQDDQVLINDESQLKSKENVTNISMVSDWLNYSDVDEKKRRKEKKAEKPIDTEKASVFGKLKLYTSDKPPVLPTIADVVIYNDVTPRRRRHRSMVFDQREQSTGSNRSMVFDRSLATGGYTTNCTIQELKKSQMGYKLLSRIGYNTGQAISDGRERSQESYRIQDECVTEFESGVRGMPCGKMCHEIGSDSPENVPDIRISGISTLTKGSEQEDNFDYMVLPRIFHCMKALKHDNQARAYGRRHSDIRTREMQHYAGLPRRLPRLRRSTVGEMDGCNDDENISAQQKPGKRLKLLKENEETIDPEKRRSILKELREMRSLHEQQNASPLSREGHQLSLGSGSKGSRKPSSFSVSDESHDTYLPRVDISSRLGDTSVDVLPDRTLVTNDIARFPKSGRPVQQYVYTYRPSDGSNVIGERLSRAVTINMDGTGTSLDHELPREIGQSCGRSRYGILDVLWTTTGDIYQDSGELEGHDDNIQPVTQLHEAQQKRLLKKQPFPIKRHFKPIRNRNLVTNPYTNKTAVFTELKRMEKARKCFNHHDSCNCVTPENSTGELEAKEMWNVCELVKL